MEFGLWLDKRKVYSKLSIAKKLFITGLGVLISFIYKEGRLEQGKAAIGKAAAGPLLVPRTGDVCTLRAALYPVFSALKQNDV